MRQIKGLTSTTPWINSFQSSTPVYHGHGSKNANINLLQQNPIFGQKIKVSAMGKPSSAVVGKTDYQTYFGNLQSSTPKIVQNQQIFKQQQHQQQYQQLQQQHHQQNQQQQQHHLQHQQQQQTPQRRNESNE